MKACKSWRENEERGRGWELSTSVEPLVFQTTTIPVVGGKAMHRLYFLENHREKRKTSGAEEKGGKDEQGEQNPCHTDNRISSVKGRGKLRGRGRGKRLRRSPQE